MIPSRCKYLVYYVWKTLSGSTVNVFSIITYQYSLKTRFSSLSVIMIIEDTDEVAMSRIISGEVATRETYESAKGHTQEPSEL